MTTQHPLSGSACTAGWLIAQLGLTDVRDLISQAGSLAAFDSAGHLWQSNSDES